MPAQKSIPRLWLVTDARNDAVLEKAIRRLPRRSGVIFRHYHLDDKNRRARFEAVKRLCRLKGHQLMLSGTARQARRWKAAGNYGVAGRNCLATAHNLRELACANRSADAVLLSPVFTTNSHPGAPVLGPVRFALIAARATIPVIAMGGMTARRASQLPRFLHGWAAIDGLSDARSTQAQNARRICKAA